MIRQTRISTSVNFSPRALVRVLRWHRIALVMSSLANGIDESGPAVLLWTRSWHNELGNGVCGYE